MFISVLTVVKDQSSDLFVCRESNAKIEFIKDFRTWHRKPMHQGIEGDLTKVSMYDLKRDKEWFIIINESVQDFRDRLNKLNSVNTTSCQTSPKTL